MQPQSSNPTNQTPKNIPTQKPDQVYSLADVPGPEPNSRQPSRRSASQHLRPWIAPSAPQSRHLFVGANAL
ncbi:unnamed protein product [Aspergillus oryzae]|uniref:Unnamed protein product n=1 Tax=Aspergillus oryzae TaxID=5062 RepID=A0AAN5BM32_ASPOZ|nr:unnamed protein product [Aspergillus oryzae]